MTYIFYDTETTGTDAFFDQILQFAAIKTDEDFNVIDKINVRCRLLPFVLPNPWALLVTGISVKELQNPDLSCYQMADKIISKLDEWGESVFIGYNSIRFDEMMMRQLFYQSFHPIYYTQLNGNARADVLKLAQMVLAYDADAIKFPINDKNKPSLKLEHLSVANGIIHEEAHEAMSDVIATMELMKLIKKKSPHIFKEWWHARLKNNVENFVNENEVFITNSLAGNRDSKYVTHLFTSKGESWLFDLSHDPSKYIDMPADEIAKILNKTSKAPFIKIKYNAQPVIKKHIGDEFKDNAATIKFSSEFQQNFAKALELMDKPEYSEEFVEERIYSEFIGNKDATTMKHFREAEPKDKFAILNQFVDERLKILGQRMLCVDYPEYIPSKVSEGFRGFIKDKFSYATECDFLTIPKAIEEANKILEKDPSQKEFVAEYIEYINKL